ncbi:DUF4249 family protein [Pedobacter sp. SYSU D00535]|uniref:DUF4249 family protein n=1 Tax=Pedobacter sp. SYSU D00535 TaxID=2810308 RepID=UPI001A96D44D|nr:DUF4249 family protein [Pedobacter sp. SYSU D00535]
MKKLNIFLLLLLNLAFTACEDVIDVDVAAGKRALVVEGWLTNKPENHFVKLYYTKGTSRESAYPALSNATVTLRDNLNNSEVLTEVSPGKYQISNLKSVEGRTYTLSVVSPEGSYEAVASCQRMCMVPDSITFKYEKKSTIYEHEGYYPRIFGQELEGVGDFGQIKLYRDGKYMNSANDFNLFKDEFVDGNYITNVELAVYRPFQKGEVVKAEIWSLTEDAFRFLTDIQIQLQNGQIFASPLENARTNIQKKSANATDVVGYFGTSLVSSVEKEVK